jgi:hypothetical protein
MPYFRGLAHERQPPDILEVLEVLKSELHTARDCKTVKDFASEFGYDAGSMSFDRSYSRQDINFLKEHFPEDYESYRAAVNIFHNIKENAASVTHLLGKKGAGALLDDVDMNLENEKPQAPAPKITPPSSGFGMGI